ncbi:STAS domain-containing protein [Actinophytocola sp.]|jgi:anti-sigma B factor antagonist|uniref:STAS domain-containing protein n=1 Tax=Actinophytocola sp. TaxID=1872138 RepID=UPI002D4B9A90|nr:STAS domain-containing protein [Actinophytocola sp.]HYQ64556.1 STAS domain-containing protein [Actinophytocola sp.]
MPELDDLLWLERSVENHSVVVRAVGEVDMLTAPRLSRQLDLAEAIVVPPAPVVLDLTGLTFLASAGLSLLLAHDKRCTELGSSLAIVPGGRAVTRPLKLTGLDKLLTVTPDFVGGPA